MVTGGKAGMMEGGGGERTRGKKFVEKKICQIKLKFITMKLNLNINMIIKKSKTNDRETNCLTMYVSLY